MALALMAVVLATAIAPLAARATDSRIGVGEVAGRAAAGASPASILKAGFPSARLSSQRAGALRVLVADLAPAVIVAAGDGPHLVTRAGRRALASDHRFQVTRARRGWRVRDLDGSLRILVRDRVLRFGNASPHAPVRLVSPLDRRFRGSFELRADEGHSIAVVNRVAVEDWVGGAAGGEAPRVWLDGAPATMDVAAILARSRATVARAARGRGQAWDLTSDDVLYLGVDGERAITTGAATRTAGRILTQGGLPLDARVPFTPAPGDGIVADPGRPAPVAAAPASPIAGARPGLGGQAVALAQGRLGTPYRWGGEDPGGFDCSGLVYWIYGRLGIALPRVAEAQGRVGLPVAASDLQAGDVVFFADSSGYVHHEGIYIGGGQMIHAPHTGAVVRVERIDIGYYARQYAGARRFSPSP